MNVQQIYRPLWVSGRYSPEKSVAIAYNLIRGESFFFKNFMQQNESYLIRKYLSADKVAVLNLIKLNTPAFFAEEEMEDLSTYLDKEVELYYVLLVDGEIVGCGGINFAENKTIGRISWDMIHPAFQGKSLGKKLLKHRLEVLRSIPTVQKITVRTSQVAYKFYEKQGFVLNEIKKNYWAEGFDMYNMAYEGL